MCTHIVLGWSLEAMVVSETCSRDVEEKSRRSCSGKSIKFVTYSKTCLKRPLKKKTKIGFQDRLSLNAGQRYFDFHQVNICL